MSPTVTVTVTTYVFGLGAERKAPPVLVCLPEEHVSARTLIAWHVQAEIERAHAARSTSLALHYLLSDQRQLYAPPAPGAALDRVTETTRAYDGLSERRYVLVVDGVAVTDLEADLLLSERSAVSFIRLLPLIGG